ncbi:MAG: hypothetical protein DMG32_25360 [Acidobacteria bacterium]|nr:MAG: hypothetical protein DMG32_25360 [Acidobacteriota bacterium]
MRPSITQRTLSVLALLAISILFVTPIMGVARAQDKPSGTQISPKVVLTTVPSPAQKGTNIVRVKLTDPAGNPISGATVTVVFFMAAMPSMNIPEMKTVNEGADKGAGIFEGKGDLGSGGIMAGYRHGQAEREDHCDQEAHRKSHGRGVTAVLSQS